jgi:hypothetical protein
MGNTTSSARSQTGQFFAVEHHLQICRRLNDIDKSINRLQNTLDCLVQSFEIACCKPGDRFETSCSGTLSKSVDDQTLCLYNVEPAEPIYMEPCDAILPGS